VKSVAHLDELADGHSHVFDVDGVKVLLIRLGDEVRAASAWCTHARTVLGPFPVDEDGLIECPLHGAIFASDSGQLLDGPTCDPLPIYPVEVGGDGTVHVAVPDPPARAGPAASFAGWNLPGSSA
jgi:3-phenylpropionate/trans-cinnamate dioxygenase ferredoxin subunit